MSIRSSLRPISLALSLAIASLLAVAIADDGSQKPFVELGLSVPVETGLEQEGVRTAAKIWVEMIDGAKEMVDAGHFYVSNRAGSELDGVLAALERAAKRGVKVRVMLSATPRRMFEGDPESIARLRSIPGVVFAALDLSKETGGIHHAKYWVVDRREAFVGSQNLDWRSLSQIHELGLHVKDERIAQQLGDIFERDLALAQGRTPPGGAPAAPTRTAAAPDGTSPTARPEIELVASPRELNPPGTRAALDALKELFATARTSVAIQLLDFDTADRYSKDRKAGPWLEIDEAIRGAARRGVKVRMLLSHWNTERKALAALRALAEEKGIEIRIDEFPRATEGFIPFARVAHAKYMVVDGETLWLGTSNWLKDYFVATRNVELIVRRPETTKQALAIFERLWASKYSAPFDPKKKYPAPEKGAPRKEPAAKGGKMGTDEEE